MTATRATGAAARGEARGEARAAGASTGTAAAAADARMAGASERATTGPTIRVAAKAVGFYGNVRYRIGDIFTLYPRTGTFTELEIDDETGKPAIDDSDLVKHRITKEVEKTLTAEEQFNPKWMVRVAADTPERVSSAQQRISEEHDRILRDRVAGGGAGSFVPEPGQGGEPAAQGKPAEGHRPTGSDGRPTGDNDVLT